MRFLLVTFSLSDHSFIFLFTCTSSFGIGGHYQSNLSIFQFPKLPISNSKLVHLFCWPLSPTPWHWRWLSQFFNLSIFRYLNFPTYLYPNLPLSQSPIITNLPISRYIININNINSFLKSFLCHITTFSATRSLAVALILCIVRHHGMYFPLLCTIFPCLILFLSTCMP